MISFNQDAADELREALHGLGELSDQDMEVANDLYRIKDIKELRTKLLEDFPEVTASTLSGLNKGHLVHRYMRLRLRETIYSDSEAVSDQAVQKMELAAIRDQEEKLNDRKRQLEKDLGTNKTRKVTLKLTKKELEKTVSAFRSDEKDTKSFKADEHLAIRTDIAQDDVEDADGEPVWRAAAMQSCNEAEGTFKLSLVVVENNKVATSTQEFKLSDHPSLHEMDKDDFKAHKEALQRSVKKAKDELAAVRDQEEKLNDRK